MKKTILLISLALTAGHALATPPDFMADKFRGYFFHEQEPTPEPKKKPEKKVAAAAPAPAPEPKPFTQDWFEKNLPKLRDQAIDNPTKENMVAYLTAQKLWTDSASNFSTAFANVVMENPWLTDEKFRPTANFGAAYYEKRAAQARNELVKKLTDTMGIWFFFASNCEYCHAEAPVLRDLRDRLGLKVLAISMDGKGLPDFPRFVRDQGQAAKYNVTMYPTMMIYRDNKLYPLAEGVLSSEQLIDRLLYFAKENGWITEKEWNRAQPVDYGGVLPPGFMQTLTPEDAADPRRLADKVKAQLMRQNSNGR